MKAANLVAASSAVFLAAGVPLRGPVVGGADNQALSADVAESPAVTTADKTATREAAKKPMSAAELQAISARLAQASERLGGLDARIHRALRRVPTAEEFRQQVADGRKEIERRRTSLAARWNDVKRIAESKHVKLEGLALRNSVPEALKDDHDFLTARARALDDARLVAELEERLIEVMLNTSSAAADSERLAVPPDSAIARERENLAASQKALGIAVLNARRKATAAKLEFDPSLIHQRAPEGGVAGDRSVLDSVERARTQLRARDTSAGLLAELEFLRAVGPLEANW